MSNISKEAVLGEINQFTKVFCWRCELGRFLSHGDENGLWWHKDKSGYHECDASGFHELRLKIEDMGEKPPIRLEAESTETFPVG